jgi:glycosyltransferase involved in cell wall biosynthesis
MRILWLTWKDRRNPTSGGAELVNEELCNRLASDGHEVTLLTAGFRGARAIEMIDGYQVIRVGGRWSVYWRAWRYYRKNLRGWADVVIDEMNTVPFFARWYVKEPNLLFVHQLCREIWFHEMWFPLSAIGYLLESVYLRLLRRSAVITVSESTRADLVRHGFDPALIQVIPEGIQLAPSVALAPKPQPPTLLAFGSIRSMKQTHHALRAFEVAKRELPSLKLIVAGDARGSYGARVLRMISRSPYRNDIESLGPVSAVEKVALYRRASLLLATSIKEGWGLTVTEAESQGTPAIVYDVDGLRESVGSGGVICAQNTPEEMAACIVRTLADAASYETMRRRAVTFASRFTFDRTYQKFLTCLPPVR